MKILDIAIKDMTRSLRSMTAVVFMFVMPLMVTGMFYFMFGNIADDNGFDVPRTTVVVANLDEGGPKFQSSAKNIPGSEDADTMGELIVAVLQSEDLADLLEVSLVSDVASARAAVDSQQAQVAVIIPADFSRQFADLEGKAEIQFYQDPTLTLGPGIVQSILNQFMDGMSGVKIALDVTMDQASENYAIIGQVAQEYLDTSLAQVEDPEDYLLEVRAPAGGQAAQEEDKNQLVRMVSLIMGGMMVFYAFYTGAASAESILKEEEERTLPRLFTTPTPQSVIMSGKLLSVFLTVSVQVITLIIVSHLIFGVQWGAPPAIALTAVGIILIASTAGIFINSLLKTTKQGGVIFGGVLTMTGMLGMISIFAMGSPGSAKLGDTVALLVPQGWATRALQQAIGGEPLEKVLVSFLAMLAWSVFFFILGVWRFNKRYS